MHVGLLYMLLNTSWLFAYLLTEQNLRLSYTGSDRRSSADPGVLARFILPFLSRIAPS